MIPRRCGPARHGEIKSLEGRLAESQGEVALIKEELIETEKALVTMNEKLSKISEESKSPIKGLLPPTVAT